MADNDKRMDYKYQEVHRNPRKPIKGHSLEVARFGVRCLSA